MSSVNCKKTEKMYVCKHKEASPMPMCQIGYVGIFFSYLNDVG